MLGERSDQRGLWEADRLYLDHGGKDTFYGLLASLRGRLFRDADFAEFYCADNGRDSVPPSLLASALLLQSHDAAGGTQGKGHDSPLGGEHDQPPRLFRGGGPLRYAGRRCQVRRGWDFFILVGT